MVFIIFKILVYVVFLNLGVGRMVIVSKGWSFG